MTAAYDTDHARPTDAAHHLVAAESLELLGDDAGRAMHLVEDLRMLVDVAAPAGDLVLHGSDAVDDWHGIPGGRTVRGLASAPGRKEANHTLGVKAIASKGPYRPSSLPAAARRAIGSAPPWSSRAAGSLT